MLMTQIYYKLPISNDKTDGLRMDKTFLYADKKHTNKIGMLLHSSYYSNNKPFMDKIFYPVNKTFYFFPTLGVKERIFMCKYVATENKTTETTITHKQNMPNLQSATRVIESTDSKYCWGRFDLLLNKSN
jgi:hypothetical protein